MATDLPSEIQAELLCRIDTHRLTLYVEFVEGEKFYRLSSGERVRAPTAEALIRDGALVPISLDLFGAAQQWGLP